MYSWLENQTKSSYKCFTVKLAVRIKWSLKPSVLCLAAHSIFINIFKKKKKQEQGTLIKLAQDTMKSKHFGEQEENAKQSWQTR